MQDIQEAGVTKYMDGYLGGMGVRLRWAGPDGTPAL